MNTRLHVSALIAGLTVLAACWTVPASATPWYQSFDVYDATTGTSEAVNLALDLGSTLQTGYNGFQGYLVNSLSGTQDRNPVLLLDVGSANFNAIASNDNLFNPDSSTNYYSGGGLGYVENIAGGESYQLFFSAADNQLEGCWNRSPCKPFVIRNFRSSPNPIPLPSTWLMLLGGLLALGFVVRRGSHRTMTA